MPVLMRTASVHMGWGPQLLALLRAISLTCPMKLNFTTTPTRFRMFLVSRSQRYFARHAHHTDLLLTPSAQATRILPPITSTQTPSTCRISTA